MIRALICLLLAAVWAPAAAQAPRPAAAFHENVPAAYRIEIPSGWQALPNDEVDFAMRDVQADLTLYVRVLEGPYGDDRDAFRTLADFFKSDLDYLVLRQGLKPLPALGREAWNFVMRRTSQPRVELVVVIPQTPNGESSIYYHLRLEAPVRRLDAIESEMDRLLQGFRITGEPGGQPVRPRAEADTFRPPARPGEAPPPPTAAEPLPQRLEAWELGYALRYPAGWTVSRLNEFTVRLSAGRDPRNRESAITIQNMASTVAGGAYEKADDVAGAFRRQIEGLDPKAEFRSQRPFQYARTRLRLTGTEFSAAYRVGGNDWRQWQIVVPRPDGRAFHAWGLTAPAERFDEHAKVAGAILESWVIAP
ncbi:hypothetical protein [Stella sp.]|uniref:hypothetical protein n=1 Tax=Stella sp. TaxID=2912054 RepID=UPI0035B13334